jgi:signal transduction histidine kinase
MSLRRLIIGITGLLSFIILMMAACLIIFTSQLKTTASEIVNRAESIRASEQLQIHLLNFGRENRLFDLTGLEKDKVGLISEDQEIENWLDQIRALVASAEEKHLAQNVREAAHEYVRTRKRLEAQHMPTGEITIAVTGALGASYKEAEKLTMLNLSQARELELKAEKDRGVANLIGIIICGLSLMMVPLLWFFVRHWIYRPLRKVVEAITSFSGETVSQRAPEQGPAEMVLIGKSFNKLADQLMDQREARLRFLASVAHDLRNPLGAIRMSAEFLTTDEMPRAEQIQMIEIISRQADHMNRMVGDLLDASRIEAGHLELRLQELNLNKVIKDAVTLHRSLSSIHTIELHLPENEVVCEGDPVRLGQVLGNLLNNAIKYSPKGGVVKVVLTVEGKNAFIRVSDKGIGISEKDKTQIFIPFRRTLATKASIPGVGLGLSVTKKIVEGHGGGIEVESSKDSAAVDGGSTGTTFVIRLPAVERLGEYSGEKKKPRDFSRGFQESRSHPESSF